MSWEDILKRDSCCENAKNRLKSIFTDRIKRGGSLENERQNIETLETLDCDELKDYLRYQVNRMKNDPAKDKWNASYLSWYTALKEILEEWNSCEGK
jgi:hypothetical protein